MILSVNGATQVASGTTAEAKRYKYAKNIEADATNVDTQ